MNIEIHGHVPNFTGKKPVNQTNCERGATLQDKISPFKLREFGINS